ncbi:MAG: hypothetical protein V1793_13850 [Pseudomonadota bacterium]
MDWLARLVTHIPSRYEQAVRYYGLYSNKSSGMSKKVGTDDTLPAVMPDEMSSKESRRNWARLIQKIYSAPGTGELVLINFFEIGLRDYGVLCPKLSIFRYFSKFAQKFHAIFPPIFQALIFVLT